MENDREWEAECVGRAWAGHIGDTRIGVAVRWEETLMGFQERIGKLCTG